MSGKSYRVSEQSHSALDESRKFSNAVDSPESWVGQRLQIRSRDINEHAIDSSWTFADVHEGLGTRCPSHELFRNFLRCGSRHPWTRVGSSPGAWSRDECHYVDDLPSRDRVRYNFLRVSSVSRSSNIGEQICVPCFYLPPFVYRDRVSLSSA